MASEACGRSCRRRLASLCDCARGRDGPNDAAGRCHCNSGPSGSRWSIAFPSPHSPECVVQTERAGEWRKQTAQRERATPVVATGSRRKPNKSQTKPSTQTDRRTAEDAVSNRKRQWQRGRWEPAVWGQGVAVNRRAAPPITPPGRARSCTCVSAPRFSVPGAIVWPSLQRCPQMERAIAAAGRGSARRYADEHAVAIQPATAPPLPLSFPR